MRSYTRIVIGVALACGLGVFVRAVALERTLPFWAVASLLELTGILIAACLWFAVRGLRPAAERAGLGDGAYAVLASSFVWMPVLVVGVFYLGHRFLGEGSGAPDWIKDASFYALAAASPFVHFTAFVLILQTSRASRWVFAGLNGLMFLIDLLFLGVATNLLQLGLG
ncbi:MAG: hypothetical protein LAN37_09605 [Acidobacteriia bacterium]|nr:hypothetical protein [Terriglobia bacterium]